MIQDQEYLDWTDQPTAEDLVFSCEIDSLIEEDIFEDIERILI